VTARETFWPGISRMIGESRERLITEDVPYGTTKSRGTFSAVRDFPARLGNFGSLAGSGPKRLSRWRSIEVDHTPPLFSRWGRINMLTARTSRRSLHQSVRRTA
jgi:hypothetical protein